MMHETKMQLIERNGMRCMGCGQEVTKRNLQWHHIKPKYVYKACHEAPDNSYENGALLCVRCHARIHKYLWWDDEYQILTDMILSNKAQFEQERRGADE